MSSASSVRQIAGDAFHLHLPSLHLGEVQDFVDEFQQVQGIPLDDLDAADLRALFGASGQQHVRKSQDGSHGRADLVTHVRQELALGPVGGLGVSPGLRQVVSHALAFGNVANVALNHVPSAFRINVADELHGDMPSVFVLQRKILIADSAELCSVAIALLELSASLKTPISHSSFPRKCSRGIAQQVRQEGIDVQHFGGHRIQDQDAVMRRLKQAPVADF